MPTCERLAQRTAINRLLGSEVTITGSGVKVENYSAAHALTGFTTIGAATPAAAPRAARGAAAAAQTKLADAGETRFYDAAHHLTGREVRSTDAKANLIGEHHDARWNITGKEVFQHRANGAYATIAYGEGGERTGTDIATVRHDGSTMVRHFDAASKLVATDMIGTTGYNILAGSAANTSFFGGLGSDTLRGNKGADTFHFDTAIGQGDVDRILAFNPAKDTIALHADIFSALPGLGTLDASAFVVGTAAHDLDDRVIYNAKTGALFYDADGSGAGDAVLFATVRADAPLTAADILVV